MSWNLLRYGRGDEDAIVPYQLATQSINGTYL